MERMLRKLVAELVRDDVKEMSRTENSTVPGEALVQFIAGALLGVLMWWLTGRCECPSTRSTRCSAGWRYLP